MTGNAKSTYECRLHGLLEHAFDAGFEFNGPVHTRMLIQDALLGRTSDAMNLGFREVAQVMYNIIARFRQKDLSLVA